VIKLLGALLVVFACAMLGFAQARRLRERPLQIRRFIIILQQLETEITYGFTPLPEALAKLARQTTEPISSFLNEVARRLQAAERLTVRQVWDLSLNDFWPSTAMKEAERETIHQLGNTLGTTDREDQLKHLRLAANQLVGREADAMEDQRRYEKMWRSLGVLGGALIVVIMY
jgi:stage III sporulation protein AB